MRRNRRPASRTAIVEGRVDALNSILRHDLEIGTGPALVYRRVEGLYLIYFAYPGDRTDGILLQHDCRLLFEVSVRIVQDQPEFVHYKCLLRRQDGEHFVSDQGCVVRYELHPDNPTHNCPHLHVRQPPPFNNRHVAFPTGQVEPEQILRFVRDEVYKVFSP